jgi:PAS domain S-box-containing protein
LLSRRLGEPGRAFRGAVVAAVETESFARLYRSIDLGEGGFIALLSDAGAFLSRVPPPPAERAGATPRADDVRRVRSTGRFEGWTTSPITEAPVLLSILAVRGFPLFVLSGREEGAVLAAWSNEAWLIFDRTLLTSAAMLTLIALAAWGLARREGALAQSWKRYQAMIEHSSDALVLTRPNRGGIFFASPAMERVLGYSVEDLRGREVLELVHPETYEIAVRTRAEQLRAPGMVSVDDLRLRHMDVSLRWVELTLLNLLEEPCVGAVVMYLRYIEVR